jgi:hypothetical protein
MKKLLLIFILTSSAAQAQLLFPTFESIGDTSFYHLENDPEKALCGFKNMLYINDVKFEKKYYTPKRRIMYLVHYVDPRDQEHVYVFYLLLTQRGYESWYEYRTNMDFTIENDNLFLEYKREN